MSATTARRSELHSTKLQTEPNTQSTPHRATHQASRTSTPRPSISPLSTASKADPLSPAATRLSNMSATIARDVDGSNGRNGVIAEVGDFADDQSSGLSDPEDDEEDLELDGHAEYASDEEEQLPTANLLDVDSEAETERLDQSPHKLRKHPDAVGRTPSKLKQTETADEELSESPSPLLTGPGAASSTSTNGTTGQKRKRSETADESPLTSAGSEVGESPRKRNHKLPEAAEDVNEENGVGIEDPHDETLALDEADDTPAPAPIRGAKGKKGRGRGRKPKEPVEEVEAEIVEQPIPGETPDEAPPPKTDEDLKHQAEAAALFENLAKQFTTFRERLYNEKLDAMAAELELLAQPDCSHPDYLRQIAAIDARLEKQQREAQAFYKYRLRCMQERVLGERSQLHCQYFQSVREVREDVLYGLGEDWFNVQKERRQAHQNNDEAYIFKFPTKRNVQIRQQAKYNQEVSVLSGIAKYVGFPAAPELRGPTGEDLEDDLKAMKLSKRAHHATHTAPVYLPASAISTTARTEQLAHQQFIEQNAWARPQPSIHNHVAPGLTHTPDWAEPGPRGPARNLIRNLSGQVPPRNHSPYATPMPQKRTQPMEYSSAGTMPFNSDGAEPSSSLQGMPPTTDRMHHVHHGGSSRPGSPLQVNKQRQNGEHSGYRNISNISGTSTIDAPVEQADRERELERERQGQHSFPVNPLAAYNESTKPPAVFDSSSVNRFNQQRRGEPRDAYANAGFRAQEGGFATTATSGKQGV
ncbi:Hypothetical protein R9X50_00012500 [Acrodontium crateriforme]|uniref:Transcriptional regulatory protein DEP1 n=1 Tax=Acrodontium crateriforme TaxID=150365 RepID=A0AAQ3LXH0_9PEZI|nr:Hypothetical protein R9X50_00012500 [Acrodontium crateriforme]